MAADLRLYHPLQIQKQGLWLQQACCARNQILRLVGGRSSRFDGSQFSRHSIFVSPGLGRFGTVRRFTPKSSNSLEDPPPPKSPLSFNILDILGLLIRIPAFLLGILGKERKFVEQIEDEIEDAAEAVEGIAEAVEDAAEAVAKIAGAVAKEAHETQEFMDKVEESTQSMRSELGTAIDVLEGAVNSEKYSQTGKLPEGDVRKASGAASRAAQSAEAAKGAASEAANKAQRVKEAADELEKAEAADTSKQAPSGDNDAGDSSKREISQSSQRYRATSRSSSSSSSFTAGKFVLVLAMLFGLLVTTQVTSTGIVRLLLGSSSSN